MLCSALKTELSNSLIFGMKLMEAKMQNISIAFALNFVCNNFLSKCRLLIKVLQAY